MASDNAIISVGHGLTISPPTVLSISSTLSLSTGVRKGSLQRIIRLILSLLISVWTTLPLYAAEKLESLRLAYPAIAPGSTPSWVTAEKQIWHKYGLDVEPILVSGGARAAQPERPISRRFRHRCHHRPAPRHPGRAPRRNHEYAGLLADHPAEHKIGPGLEGKNSRHLTRARRQLHSLGQAAAR